ncbi:MAG TPA: cyclic phosphodiesterase-like protein [Cyanobacteria bacterium UBA8803]|nr:cyclic phosphodiesterase-like protein [Cyanobacteria bacterium UBA9273]HBL61686.1 cyclic phosphodiesterase-like protein [Cyanobacteria bacterium UBA8803]
MKTKVAFWLVPAVEDRAFFQEMIDTLAHEYDAPAFVPHVTIYFGECQPDESPTSLVEEAIQGVKSFSLAVDRLLYTDQFTKTLFVQFQPNSVLTQISETLRHSLGQPSDFVLNPHLSLIYKQMSEETQKYLVTSITLPKSEVFFNEVQAILAPNKTQTREDVESWKVLYKTQLDNS